MLGFSFQTPANYNYAFTFPKTEIKNDPGNIQSLNSLALGCELGVRHTLRERRRGCDLGSSCGHFLAMTRLRGPWPSSFVLPNDSVGFCHKIDLPVTKGLQF